MAGDTSIEWATKVWNPIAGCAVVSPGCTNCYAMPMAARIEAMAAGRGQTSAYDGLTRKTKAGAVWTGEVRTVPKALDAPLRWRKPERVFVNSMSDLFHPGVRFETIAQIYGVMVAAHHLRGHTFMVLTKRPERACELLSDPAFWNMVNAFANDHVMERVVPLNRRSDDARATMADDYGPGNPPPGIWFGISAEDQPRLEDRAEAFVRTPAALHFVSAEPLLGPLDLCNIIIGPGRLLDLLAGVISGPRGHTDWVAHARLIIAGGESGPKARECWVPNVRSVVRQCGDTGTAVFVKQLGARVIDRNDAGFDGMYDHQWPDMDPDDVEENDRDTGYQGADLRVRQIPVEKEAA